MTKVDLNILERIFQAEIENRLPAQLKSKHLDRMWREGFVYPLTITLPGPFPVNVKGWALTERGRVAYCESCSEESKA